LLGTLSVGGRALWPTLEAKFNDGAVQTKPYEPREALCERLAQDGYFSSLYGADDISVTCDDLRIVWMSLLSNETLASLEVCLDQPMPPQYPLWLPVSSDYHPPDSVWLANSSSVELAVSQQWVEVTHCASDVEASGEFGDAMFLYVVAGSGLWVNVGNTTWLQDEGSASATEERNAAIEAAAANTSMDSLQYRHLHASRSDDDPNHAVVTLIMAGPEWRELTSQTSAELAMGGVFKCGTSATSLRDCTAEDGAVRVSDAKCQEAQGERLAPGSTSGKQYLRDSRVIAVTRAALGPLDANSTVPYQLDAEESGRSNLLEVDGFTNWRYCSDDEPDARPLADHDGAVRAAALRRQAMPSDPRETLCAQLKEDGYFSSLYGAEDVVACADLRIVWLPLLSNETIASLEVCLDQPILPEHPLWIPIADDYHPPDSVWLANASAVELVEPQQWIEVTHCASLIEADGQFGSSMWLFGAPGSGLWINVGKTEPLGDVHKSERTERIEAAAANASVDSLQYLQVDSAFDSGEQTYDRTLLVVIMTGEEWGPLTAHTGAELAMMGVFKCGTSASSVRDCAEDEGAVRMSTSQCQEQESTGVENSPVGKSYMRDSRVIELTNAAHPNGTDPTVPYQLNATDVGTESTWRYCASP